MKSFYLIDYLRENYPIDKEVLDALKYDLHLKMFSYGDQLKINHEDGRIRLSIFKESLKDILRSIRGYLNQYPINDKPKIISNAYYTYNNELGELGYNVYLPPWVKQFFRGYPPKHIKNEIDSLRHVLSSKGFNDILSQGFMDEVKKIQDLLMDFYENNKFCALCVHSDRPLFENLSVKIFQKMNRPSFLFSHGLTQTYDLVDDNRTTYLVVFGDKVKENYIKIGFDGNKIFVSGHPYYKKFNWKDFKFGFENILVMGYPAYVVHSESDGLSLQDRGTSILYLYSIENILKRFGVRTVRFRPHPAENPNWYFKHIDKNFFKLDLSPLQEAIQQSSLVIGNSSTTFLDTMYYGVNYIMYEPSVGNFPWGAKYRSVNPFDGSDPRVPVAKSEEDLLYILNNKIRIEPSAFNDYVKTPFDISFMKKLILEQ